MPSGEQVRLIIEQSQLCLVWHSKKHKKHVVSYTNWKDWACVRFYLYCTLAYISQRPTGHELTH
jgi:hypothetical protein